MCKQLCGFPGKGCAESDFTGFFVHGKYYLKFDCRILKPILKIQMRLSSGRVHTYSVSSSNTVFIFCNLQITVKKNSMDYNHFLSD